MNPNRTRILVLPGYANSGPGHWQTRWEALDSAFERVAMPDWHRPVREAWCDALEQAVAAHEQGSLLLAAHSLGCLTTAFWAVRRAGNSSASKVAGALLVAVPDPEGPAFPVDAHGFAQPPMQRLPFPTIVVASSNDPYGGAAFGERCARAWGSRFIDIGARGHINAESGLDDWDEGRRWLESLAS
jgi:predicted alpha/beta hydrolase family esterase